MTDIPQMPADFAILIDFPDEGGLVQASLGDDVTEWLQKSQMALDKAMTTIVGMAYRASQLRDRIPREFTQAEIEFGVKFDYEAGALLAKAGAEGSISVKLTWERKKDDDERLVQSPRLNQSGPLP
ncbi:MAG: hypothetical protein KC418_16235 [Anaerolineales bacterium]|nr:hypothetical protein [Anaerolineales bacterium]MCB8953159.1 hypothetical protein [Ardenticatenales bacterium]